MGHDVRLALRRFRAKPVLAATLLLIVGVGIGAATAVFSVVDQTMLRRPPFARAERLVEVWDFYRESGASSTSLSLRKVAGLQARTDLLERLEAYAAQQFDLPADRGEPERIRGLTITTGLLPMLGVRPMFGREFTADDGRPGSARVALIGEALWRRRFGGDPSVLGATITLSDRVYSIVGVMPATFRLAGNLDQVWVPVNVSAPSSDAPSSYVALGRLATGVTWDSAQKLADAISAQLQKDAPLSEPPFWDVRLQPKAVAFVQPATRTALYVLLGAVAFVLLITCANLGSLFLAQVRTRERDSAIRAAVGAGRGRLLREVMVESVMLAIGGGALGVLLAGWGVDAIVAAAPPRLAFNATRAIEIDLRVLLAAAAMTLGTGLVFGIGPALRGSAPDVEGILKSGAPGAGGRTPLGRLSGAFVIAEVAFSLVLLVGTALMLRTFVNLHKLDPGFVPDGLLTVKVSLPTDKYVGEPARAAFFEEAAKQIRALPGVSDVAVAAGLFGGTGITFGRLEEIEGRGDNAAGGAFVAAMNSVTPDYFRTLRMPVVEGRPFAVTDGPEAAIVSRAFAAQVWPGAPAVGRSFRIGTRGSQRVVVGVVGDLPDRVGDLGTALHVYSRYAPRPSVSSATPPRSRGYSERVLVVRAEQPGALVPAVRQIVWGIDAQQPLGQIELASETYADTFGRERFVLQLMVAFGVLAGCLTASGIFGVLSQHVIARTREIGIRVALGATRRDIARLVLARGLALLAAGAALGTGAALVLSRYLEALLFGVRPIDPASFGVVATAMAALAVVACWLPLRRATRIDPVQALRSV